MASRDLMMNNAPNFVTQYSPPTLGHEKKDWMLETIPSHPIPSRPESIVNDEKEKKDFSLAWNISEL